MKRNEEKARYMIGVVAQMLGIHPQTLRFYEREGLIGPNRTKGNTRLYSDEDIERMRLILRLTRDLGVNLAGVEVILQMRQQVEEMRFQLESLAPLVRQSSSPVPGRQRQVRGGSGKPVRIKIEKG